MGDVLMLVSDQSRETLALLRALKIGAANGDVIGVEVRVRLRSGNERTFAAGTKPRRAKLLRVK